MHNPQVKVIIMLETRLATNVSKTVPSHVELEITEVGFVVTLLVVFVLLVSI